MRVLGQMYACQPQIFISSADWMPRNLYRRIELAFPVEDGVLRERLTREVLGISLADNVKARFLRTDGSYRRAKPPRGEPARRSQLEFIAAAEAETREDSPLKPVDGKTRFQTVKLAQSPFATRRVRK